VWNEFRHRLENAAVRSIYPDGIHTTIASALVFAPFEGHVPVAARTATLDAPEHGLTDERLADATSWSGGDHKAPRRSERGRGRTRAAPRARRHGNDRSAFWTFLQDLCRLPDGPHCSLKWREADERERLWVVERAHPIAAGLGEYFELPNEENVWRALRYSAPDELVFISWFEGGEVFRSGCCWQRGPWPGVLLPARP